MVTFFVAIGIVLLSVFVGSAIAWAIAQTLLGAMQMGVGRPALPVEVPVTSSPLSRRTIRET
jgi:hypothetical protein